MADSHVHPERLGRYEVEALIGAGAMGRVYRALDPAVGRQVAIKTIRPDHADRPKTLEYMQRFQREARAVGALSHPNIVSVFDVGEDFLVMELLDGVDLSHHLESHGPMELDAAIELFSAVADAIDAAHAGGVIHRDLKPSNIMILSDGRPKLMDFGVARMESSAMTRTGEVLGSPSYMAPEQVAGLPIDNRADIFSLAVVIYESLTGQRPFQGDTITTVIYRVVHQPALPPRHWRPDLPERFDAVFEKALAKTPDERYGSARELVAALSGEAPPPVKRPAQPGTAAPVAKRPSAAAETAIVADAAELQSSPGETIALDGLAARADGSEKPRSRRGPIAAVLGVLGVMGLLGIAAVAWWMRPIPPSQLAVQTRPPGAEVSIDGAPVGISPLSVELEPGSHELSLTLEGYAQARMRLDVREGEQPAPLQFELTPIVAHLTVTSEPAGADVFVDGERVGVTPLQGLSVAPGSLDVLVNLIGVGAWRRSVEAVAGQSLELEASLRAAPQAPVTGPGPGGAWEVGAAVTAPRRVSGSPVRYPEAASRLGQEGVVTIEMIVTEEGVPVDLEVVESAGEILDAAVLEAVASWRYDPAERNGEKVRARWRIRQRFKRAR